MRTVFFIYSVRQTIHKIPPQLTFTLRRGNKLNKGNNKAPKKTGVCHQRALHTYQRQSEEIITTAVECLFSCLGHALLGFNDQ